MRKQDEIELFNRIKNKRDDQTIRDICKEMGFDFKKSYYILSKWCNQGIMNCGVSVYAGWLEVEELPND